MATILYVILKLAGEVDETSDLLNICQLMALDTISFMLLVHWWQRRGK